MKKILVITSSIDYTVDYIISKYTLCHFYRMNVDMLQHYNIVVTETGWKITTNEWRLCDDDIDGIYYRKPRLPDINYYGQQYVNMIQRDIISLIEGIVNSFEGLVISKPFLLHCCENKVYQLQIARKVGFLIPQSLITNSTRNASEFVKISSIIKPLTTGKIIEGNTVEIFQTARIKDITENIELTPIYLQNYVEKNYEVRATFVDKRVFCVRIDSSNNVDWRDENAHNNYSIVEMPKEIYNKCIKIMNIFQVKFAAFDFIVNDNKWVFLELNPNGQWLWLEEELDIHISECIVNLLNGGAR